MNNKSKTFSAIGCPRLKASAYDVSNIRLELVKPRKRKILLTKLGIYTVLTVVSITVMILVVRGL